MPIIWAIVVMVFHRPFGHLFPGSVGRCPRGWLPALAVTPSGGSYCYPVPWLACCCAELLRRPLRRAVCPGGWGHRPPGALQRIHTSEDIQTCQRGDSLSGWAKRRANKRTQGFSFINTSTGKPVYPKIYLCYLSFLLGYFSPHILRIRFWVLAFSFDSLWGFFYLYSNNPAFFFYYS